MTTLRTILAALLLCAPAQAQQLKTVMVNTNGVVQFPTNFWQTNAGTNFQQFLGTPTPVAAAPTNAFLKIEHRASEARFDALGIEYPHASAVVNNRLFVGRRGITGAGSGEIVIFNDPLNNFTNKTTITFTNSGGIPEIVYSTNTGLVYAATVSNGIYSINPTNNATSLFIADPISFLGTVAVSSNRLWWADGRVLKSYALSNGSLVASYTNTNVTITGGGVIAGFHGIAVTPDESKLIIAGTSTGTTTNHPATIAVFNVASNAFTSTTVVPNQYLITDDIAADNNAAYLGFEAMGDKPLAFNIATQTFTELATNSAGRAFFGALHDGIVYFGAIDNNVLAYNTATGNSITYATDTNRGNNVYNELLFISNRPFVTTWSTATNTVIAELVFTNRVRNALLNANDGAGVFQETFTVYTNTLTSSITAPSGRAVWLDYVADGTNRTVDATGQFTGDLGRSGDIFVIRNRGTSNNLEVRRTGTLVSEGNIAPGQQRAWVFTGTGSGEARWKLLQGLAPLGLSATWLTNTNVTNFRTAIGLGTTNDVVFNSITSSSIKEASLGTMVIDLENNALTAGTNYVLEWSPTQAQFNRPLTFFGTNTASTTRTNLGLGGGVTTNITFVDAATNTNSVTISNGIITGWTQ